MAKMADDTKVTKAYAGGDSNVAKEAREGTSGFKRGGRAKKKDVGEVHGVMSMAHAGRKPRKSGGGVFSSAASGTPRKPSSHY
jgi:hypothetical protein